MAILDLRFSTIANRLMTNGDKKYFDPKVLAGISNLYLRARWVVEGIMSGIHSSRAKGFSVEFERFQKAVAH
jgi:hypothetical protein